MNPKLQKALELHQSGDIESAEKLYAEIIKKEPKNSEALHLFAILRAQEESWQDALELLEKALALTPENPGLYSSLGNVLKKLGRIAEAILHYEKAINLNPTSATAHNNLGALFASRDENNAAIVHYQKALEIRPNYSDAHYNLGLLFAKENKPDKAILRITKAIELNPSKDQYHSQIAQIYYKKKNLSKAIEHYKKAFEINPDNLNAEQNLGALFAETENFPLAIKYLKNALEKDPKHIETLSNIASVLLQERNLDGALEYYIKLLSYSPNRDVYYNTGVIYMDKSSHGEALPYFLEILKSDPLDLPTLHNLGAIYLKMENFEKASEQYQKILEIEPINQEISYILAALKQENIPSKAPKEYLEHLFDQYAPRFDAHLAQFLKYRVPDLLLEATEEFLKKDLNILDLGCGTGLGGEKFRSFAQKLIGIDISSKMLELAREKKIYDELILADIHTALTSYQKEFDLILAADSLVYSGDLESIFANANRVLKFNGYFAFTCEKGEVYPYNLQTNARFAHHPNYIQELASKHGFKILKESPITLRKQKAEDVPGEIYLFSST